MPEPDAAAPERAGIAGVGSDGPMYITWAVFNQYEPQTGRRTASAMAAKSSLSSIAKNAGDSRPRLENRMVLAPTKAAPSSPRPWVAEPGSTPVANASAAQLGSST